MEGAPSAKCSLCPKEFSSKQGLSRHVTVKHRGVSVRPGGSQTALMRNDPLDGNQDQTPSWTTVETRRWTKELLRDGFWMVRKKQSVLFHEQLY